MLDSPGGPSAKVGSSATFGVVVFMASILNYLGGPSAKVSASSAKYVCTGIQPGKYQSVRFEISIIVIWEVLWVCFRVSGDVNGGLHLT